MKSQIKIAGLVMGIFLTVGCASRSAAPARKVEKSADGVWHIVRPGQNLYRIGKAYDVSVTELARLNSIPDVTQIRVGQRIFVPGATRVVPVEIIVAAPRSAVQQDVAESRQLPTDGLLWPVSGMINSPFGARGVSFHDGIDIAAPEGTPVLAIESGVVVYSDQLRGYGNIVIIRHAGELMSVYAHNQINLVGEGDQVARGAMVARVGSTGRVTGPHLHFEIRKNNIAQDPLLYLPELCCAPASDNLMPSG